MGDFSDWEGLPMEKGEDGFFFAPRSICRMVATSTSFGCALRAGFFDPDTWVEVVDPYATDIDDANQTGILRVKDGEAIVDTYVWQHDDVPLPGDHQLIIYELHVGDFSGGEADAYPRGKFDACYREAR